jgi:hypothetical protein
VGVACALSGTAVEARVWTDSSGNYTLEAELVTFNERSVVLQRADHELVAFPIEKLSAEDRAYLESAEAKEADQKSIEGTQTWALRNGAKVTGRLVDYTSRDVTISQRRRRIYVNDRALNNLPEFYQQLIPEIVSHFEKLPRADRRALNAWAGSQGSRPRTFKVDGVILETENGDEYGIPFFLFSDADLAVIKPGWDEWLAVHGSDDFGAQEDQAFLVRSLAAARSRDQEVQREIALMQLQLQAVEAGLTSLWEVTLHPAAGQGGPPLWVVVPGRDSRQATQQALDLNPGYVAGPVRRVSRR